MIQVVAQTIVDNLKYAHAAIIRYTEESRTGSAVAFYPPNERITALFTSLGLGVPTGQAKNNIVTLEPGVNALWDRIMQGQLVTSTSLADFCTPWLKRPIAEAVEERMGTCSYVACPMQVDGHMVGIIFAATRGSAATTEQQQSLMVTARQAALAMHYAELYDQVVAGRERQQALSRRLLEIQEDERRAIARELHDEIGQALTALKLNLRASVPSMDALKRAKHQEQAVAIVDNTLQQVRNLSRDLHPSILDDLGLAPALRWYIDLQMQSSGLSVMLKLDEVRTGPDAHVRITAFRIAQEALTNVLRHARAKTVEVELRERAGVIDLKIRDDGVGFDVEAARRDAAGGRSLGILSMQERADFVGGSFSIASAPGHGTEVRARFTSSDVAQASQ